MRWSGDIPQARPDRLDGLRLDWGNADGSGSWLLVRASNTEPIVRIIAEAPTADEAQRLCDAAAASDANGLASRSRNASRKGAGARLDASSLCGLALS